MRVLITGATGFVGSALARRLVAEGFAVRGTYRGPLPPAIAGVEWRLLSRLDAATELNDVLKGCDSVVHLAALAHQHGRAGIGRWQEFSSTNVEGTRALAQASSAARVGRFIFMSSVGAICSRSESPVDELTPPSPDSDYGRSKLEAEFALQRTLVESRTDWCILRPPLIYGPGNPGNMKRLMQLVATGWPLPLGSIHNRRTFIFVDNLIDALVTVIRHPRPIGAAYMVSDDSDFTTPGLVTALAAATGHRARLVRTPLAILNALGHAGDAVEKVFGVTLGIDSYSVSRLLGSLQVNSTRFRGCFGWQPPLDSIAAIELTCKSITERIRT